MEEGQAGDFEEEREAEGVAVEGDGAGDVLNGDGDLAEGGGFESHEGEYNARIPVTLLIVSEMDQLRFQVATWKRLAPELDAIRERDNIEVSRHETLRQLFAGMDAILTAPGPASSGLIEQQRWFSKVRAASAKVI